MKNKKIDGDLTKKRKILSIFFPLGNIFLHGKKKNVADSQSQKHLAVWLLPKCLQSTKIQMCIC